MTPASDLATTAAEQAHTRHILINHVLHRTPDEGLFSTPISGLKLFRSNHPTALYSCMIEPSLCLTIQGRKRVLLGETDHVYDIQRFLIVSVDVPVPVQIVEASPDQPYLSVTLNLDRQILGELLAQAELPPPRGAAAGSSVALGETVQPLLEAVKRLLALLDEPASIPALAPLIQREIFYRLLISDQGARLRHIASTGSQGHRIARAVEWLKANYAQPLRIDEVAARVQMSASSFHQHFRALTAMSPLQYQKWLRLNEARRLLLTEQLDAATTAFRVGYDSATQFSREYSRQFGAPPLRDIRKVQSGHPPISESDAPSLIAV